MDITMERLRTFFNPLKIRIEVFFQVPFLYKNYLLAYADYFRVLKNKKVLYELRTGEKFWARAGKFDIAMITEVYGSKAYYRPELNITVKQNDVVLDVGAFIGDSVVYFANQATQGHIHGFEPSPTNFELLQENISLNKISNSTIFQKAIAANSGLIHFNISESHENSNSMINSDTEAGQRKVTVEAININEVLNSIGNVTFMKMDCEGAEFEIFETIDLGKFSSIRCMIVEYHLTGTRKQDERYQNLINRIETYFTVFEEVEIELPKVTRGVLFCNKLNRLSN